AFHDSAERYPQPKCHPETRTQMLQALWNWGLGNDSFPANDLSTNILWLHGPAGSGKSAIAQSFCEKLEGEKRLAGRSLFKRGDGSRGNAKKLFSTLANQPTRREPELKQAICHIVEHDLSIVDRSLSLQLQKLIIE
ncbi:hypothetical protein C8J57DRAFT_1021588, partial [Mycena rebaudengoi]